ncbi:MAG: 2-octaprenyl-6-methoxyphenyl hydroxylase [Woeseiaceae bacterium]
MSNIKHTDFDLIIIGGGLVGASLACALADSDLRIAIIESYPFKTDNTEYQPAFDARSVALSFTSKQIFDGIGIWHSINQLGIAKIKNIHVSDRGHAGVTRLKASDEGVDALGYVVETRVIGKALFEYLKTKSNVSLIAPAKLKNFEVDETYTTASIELTDDDLLVENKTLTSKLIVAADGDNSIVRRLSGVRIKQRNYEQCAIIANVAMDRPHNNQAYERFTDSGPLAMLPMAATEDAANRYSLVWTVEASEQKEMMAWDDETFLLKLKARFGERAGQFISVSPRHTYPLTLMRAQEHVQSRLAIIGNAAHTLHPVAGQGFNLGLRDVAALSQVVVDALKENKDIGELTVLNEYAAWRRRDHIQTAMATDGLVRLFSNNFLPLAGLRNLGLLVVDLVPPLKKVFARHAMGFVGKLPRLARGLKL